MVATPQGSGPLQSSEWYCGIVVKLSKGVTLRATGSLSSGVTTLSNQPIDRFYPVIVEPLWAHNKLTVHTGVASGHHDLTIPAAAGRKPGQTGPAGTAGRRPGDKRGLTSPPAGTQRSPIPNTSPADWRQLGLPRGGLAAPVRRVKHTPLRGRSLLRPKLPGGDPAVPQRPASPVLIACAHCRHLSLESQATFRQLGSLQAQCLLASTQIYVSMSGCRGDTAARVMGGSWPLSAAKLLTPSKADQDGPVAAPEAAGRAIVVWIRKTSIGERSLAAWICRSLGGPW
jgi:hypothetical protein